VPKVRESTVPPQELWESFFCPTGVLDALGYGDVAGDVVEFGCGYGTFTIPAARRTHATVYALDIDPSMVAATAKRAAEANLTNVVAEERDFVVAGSGRPAGSVGFVMLFNILHFEEPVSLLREAYRVLHPSGIAGVIHWRSEIETPRGPPLYIRPSLAQCRTWAIEAGLRCVRTPEMPGSPWHWGMVLARP
jgi:SAM-dependent methyltransferase